MNVTPLILRDADGARRMRTCEDYSLSVSPYDAYIGTGRPDALLVVLAPTFSISALLTAPELRALARAATEVADMIDEHAAVREAA